MILASIGLTGIVALISILIETIWSRRNRELQQVNTDFLGFFHSSLGSYIVGFGAICSMIAFPLDTYWHSLYGIDVSLWAPFHTMIFIGGILGTFGTVYILLSAAHLVEAQQEERWTTRLSYSAIIIALGILLSKLGTFTFPTLAGQGTLSLPFGTLNLFPLMMSACTVFVCVLALRSVPWPGAVTLVIGVSLLLFLLVRVFVPPMTTLLMQAEHETYLPRVARIGALIIPLLGQTPLLLLTGFVIDGVAWLGRRSHWSLPTLNKGITIAAVLSILLVASGTLILAGVSLATGAHARASGHAGVMLLISFVLALPGGLLGSWLGFTISEVLRELQR